MFAYFKRRRYERIQVARSRAKFGYCKVPMEDVWRYRETIGRRENILCLGVRNGTEVDRFRIAFPEAVVTGVEINPDCNRPDVWVGSFDRLPDSWAAQFDLVFSNSFDHAFDPAVTAQEWQRVLAPGGMLIVAVNGPETPTATDINVFSWDDLYRWFDQCALVRRDVGHYHEAWLQKRA